MQLLPNGNISRTNIKDLILQNTCAFDAVVEAFAVAYKEIPCVKTLLEQQDSSFSTLVKAVSEKDDTVDILRLRAEILSNYFVIEKRSNIRVVDCSCNVTRIFEGAIIE